MQPPSNPAVPDVTVQANALRAAFPDYQVILTHKGGENRFEVIRRRGTTGPWCLISTDAREIWQELCRSRSGTTTAGLPSPS